MVPMFAVAMALLRYRIRKRVEQRIGRALRHPTARHASATTAALGERLDKLAPPLGGPPVEPGTRLRRLELGRLEDGGIVVGGANGGRGAARGFGNDWLIRELGT